MSVVQGAPVPQDPVAGEVIPPSDSSSPSGMTVDGTAAAAAIGDDGAQDGLGSTPVPPSPGEPKAPDWRDARIAKLTAQKKELQEQLLRKPASAPGVAPAAAPVVLDEAEVERRATAKATDLAAAAAWDARCVATVEQGKKEFPDFEDKIVGLRTVLDDSDPLEARSYRDMVEIAMDTGEGPKLIHFLGSNPAEAQRIMGLSPAKKGIELAKLASKPSEPKAPGVSANPLDGAVSQAPKPITAVGRGTGAGVVDPSDPTRSDKLSSKEWFARRAEQAAANFKATDRRTRA